MNQLLEEIEYNDSIFPEAQLRKIINNKEEFIPELLEMLKNTRDNYEEFLTDPHYMGNYYAIFLLAQFKEKESFPIIMDLISLPDEIPFDLFGDLITEDLCNIIASVCNGHIEPIKSLIENQLINEYVRNACIRSLVVLFSEGVLSKHDLIQYFKTLLDGKLKEASSDTWYALIDSICDIGAFELQEHTRKIFLNELISSYDMCFQDVEKHFIIHGDSEPKFLNTPRFKFITDTIESLRAWACFNNNSTLSKTIKQISNKTKKKNKRKQIKASKTKQRKK